jgi:hypothetical protein
MTAKVANNISENYFIVKEGEVYYTVHAIGIYYCPAGGFPTEQQERGYKEIVAAFEAGEPLTAVRATSGEVHEATSLGPWLP